MSDDTQRQYREVQAHFRLPSVALVEKDVHVVRAIQALNAIDAAPFALVFAGGTALARAHKLVKRMSEDVDFKVVPLPAAPVSASRLRKQLGTLRDRVTASLREAGFGEVGDPRSRNGNRYSLWQVPYGTGAPAGEGLRPAIQIEMTYAQLRLPAVFLPVSSFVADAFSQSPEVSGIDCASLIETAAEKLVSLTRRTAMELAGLSPDPDPTLVRHIYDLHALANQVEASTVIDLARNIAKTDAAEFRNQYPAYAEDIAGETRKALDELQGDATRRRYDAFMVAMVYGDTPEFGTAMATVADWAERFISTAHDEER